ncbi:MAG TPA: hypothetical protein VMV69_13520 [Pirellulales bacterium]|nr:hypothetical protein [Pirellulales bacterium]
MRWFHHAQWLSSLLVAMLAAWLVAGAAGCAAFKASQQPERKNLSVLKPGTPRTHMIAELGAPIWSERNPDGSTTDVFSFKQGYSKRAKTGRALFHGAADVVTGGLWEVAGIPIETVANGTDVRLVVTCEANGYISKVEPIKGGDTLNPKPLLARRKQASKMSTVSHRQPKAQPPATDEME